MSKLIPPLVSTTPPPIGIADVDENEDDEFGDFAAADDTTYGCDSFSIPNTPEDSPRKTPNIINTSLTTTDIGARFEVPQILSDKEKTKDHQDKRKNVAGNKENAHETTHAANGIEMPNTPMHSDSNSINKSLTNGHNCNDNVHSRRQEQAPYLSSMDHDVIESTKDDDDLERPPQLFDDDSEEKEEISETPSNFSISFDDNVICDDDEADVSETMPIELPNHVHEVDEDYINEKCEEIVSKVAETCTNIQEFDDFDEEWKYADVEFGKCEEIVLNSESLGICKESVDNHEETIDVTKENHEDFGDFNAFDSVPSIPVKENEETVDEVSVSCDIPKSSTDFPVYTNLDDPKPEDIVDFDDFQFTEFAVQPPQTVEYVQTVENAEEKALPVDDFDDFADFSSALIEYLPAEVPKQSEADQEEAPSQPVVRSASWEQDGGGDDDDFGDFDDYTTSTSSSTTVSTTNSVALLNPDKVYEETEVIFKVMFEPVVVEDAEYEYSDATVKSAIFGQIKDVTDTHALKYQWGKSQVQQGLLKALNIDTRNILYAHGMPMPKFAANLGMAPLEPVKSDILMPTQAPTAPPTPLTPSSDASGVQTTSGASASQQNGDIPAAQFDWSASGLANPLDSNQTSTLFDLEQLAASLSIPTSTSCAVGVESNQASEKIDEDWDLWLQSVSKEESKPTPRTSRTSDDIKFDENSLQKPPTYDTESVNSLQFPEMADVDESKGEAVENDEFSDFAAFQSSYSHQTQPQVEPVNSWTGSNMIPLRETYIDDVKSDWSDVGVKSNNHSRKSSYEPMERPETKEESGWLKPTILTPVLTHKEVKIPDPVVAPVQAQKENLDDDDFTDFQDFQTSSVPVANGANVGALAEVKTTEVLNAFGGNLLNPTVLQPILLEPVKLPSALEPQTILWPEPGITDEELARFDLYAKKDGNYSSGGVNPEPVASMNHPVDPSSASVSKAPETKLSGPGGALMVEKHVVVPANKVILPFNEVLLPPNNQVVISKDLVLPILESSPRKYTPQAKTPATPPAPQDDDDWSDFISTQPTPAVSAGVAGSNTSHSKHTLCSTSTPELSLSIPQLRSMQNIQPPSKPPIPVITPRGLVQTKIPTMSPSTPVKSLPQTALHVQPPVDGYQPAIISTQFVAQLSLNSNVNQSPFSDFLQNGHYQTTSIPTNGPQGLPHPTHQSPQKKLNGLHDDDEWSDFMSSQPVNTGNHSLYTPTATAPNVQPFTLQPGSLGSSMIHYNQPNLFGGAAPQARTDWNRNGYPQDLPNIITNPVHFQSYPTMNTPANVLNKKAAATNGVLHSKNKKPQNLNVARLPDLDFVAPKTKVFHNNKK